MWNAFERRRLDIHPKIPIAAIPAEDIGAAEAMHFAAAELE
jgi:hypothetical protein